ncbi:MAG: trypsin-like peptidase domain-containing protein [Proteobacteria bacterium]|nr:trypsin-like peptidase domain-containing protein [Pseudomonadota bacterium]
MISSIKKYWILFCQVATVSLAIAWVLHMYFGEVLFGKTGIITLREAVPPPPRTSTASFYAAVRQAMPAVVSIYTSTDTLHRSKRKDMPTDPLEENPNNSDTYSLGSGVIVSPQGYILTNQHVVAGATEIEVGLADGRTTSATIVGSDPDTDLAVLKINLPDLPSITFGSSKHLRIGDQVLAIGNPFGVGLTVTSGIVSALGRSRLGIDTYENFIQTDAAINPGNSGGALVDASGNLVGINTAIYSRNGGSMGIGFAIPEASARRIMDALIQYGHVTRGWIGVEVQDMTPELADSFSRHTTSGALIAAVKHGSPAEKAGIKPGDILSTINGRPVRNSSTMLNLIAALKPGKTAIIGIIRASQPYSYAVRVGTRPKTPQQND